MTISGCGSVVVWSDILTSAEDEQENPSLMRASTSLKKEFIKNVKLGDKALRVIRSIDGFVLISDIAGSIRFYDKDLKILFWCPSHESIDSIVTISFDLTRKGEHNEASPADDKSFSIRDFFVRT